MIPILAQFEQIMKLTHNYITKYSFKRRRIRSCNMFSSRTDQRFQLNKTKSNILMTQIRAQKNIKQKCEPILSARRIQQLKGKKVFKQTYYKPSCLYSQLIKQEKPVSPIKKYSTKVNLKNICTNQEQTQSRPKTGRRMFQTHERLISTSPKISARNQRIFPQTPSYRKKRFDSSPVNQNRVSQNSPFKF